MPISAPTVGLSFGSFGDIVTVLQLAWELRAALDESAGASAELHALVGDVDSFTRALQDVQANFERRRRTLRPDVVNGIAAALSRCRNVLGVIQQRIERARAQTSSSGWHKYWGTTAWSILGGKKDVEALRARLSDQLGIMQLYLSLSEAHGHEQVEDALVANGTTLQRIYSVVQDIQLRFDFGVPGFQFYTQSEEWHFQPLARTSLQRFRDVCEALQGPDDAGINTVWTKNIRRNENDFKDLSVRSTRAILPINVGDRNNPLQSFVSAHFFREVAFGDWQVLVARLHFYDTHLDGVLKTLLERNHTVGVECNCPLACSTRYQDDADDLLWRREATKVYSEVLSLLFKHLQPVGLKHGWFHSLRTAFLHWPDPDLLRLSVSNVFPRQRLSPADMVDLISKTPKCRRGAHPVALYAGRHELVFYVDGGALSESLTGRALPIPAGTMSYHVRLPDWAYNCFEKDESGRSVLSLATNLDKECGCYECVKQHGDTLEADITEAREM